MHESTFKKVLDGVGEVIATLLFWVLFVHGLFVFLPTTIGGLAIYGLHAPSVIELGLFTTLFSLAASTLIMLIGLLPKMDKDFSLISLFSGWAAGAVAVLVSTIVFSLYRLSLLVLGLPQPIMPPAWTYALGVAIFATVVALAVGLSAAIEEAAKRRAHTAA